MLYERMLSIGLKDVWLIIAGYHNKADFRKVRSVESDLKLSDSVTLDHKKWRNLITGGKSGYWREK